MSVNEAKPESAEDREERERIDRAIDFDATVHQLAAKFARELAECLDAHGAVQTLAKVAEYLEVESDLADEIRERLQVRGSAS